MNNKIYYAAVALATIPNSVFAQQAETTTEKPIELTPIPGLSEDIKRNLLLVPMVTIDGHLLRFYNQFDSDITIEIAQKGVDNENPTIVYSALKLWLQLNNHMLQNVHLMVLHGGLHLFSILLVILISN